MIIITLIRKLQFKYHLYIDLFIRARFRRLNERQKIAWELSLEGLAQVMLSCASSVSLLRLKNFISLY